MQLHSDLFPEFGCDGELIELSERSTQMSLSNVARSVGLSLLGSLMTSTNLPPLT
jgi:hypothetical protein